MTALDLLNIADIIYKWFDHFLYLPVLGPKLLPVLDYLPRTVWAGVCALVGYDSGYHIDLGELPMMARNDVGGTSSKNTMHWI